MLVKMFAIILLTTFTVIYSVLSDPKPITINNWYVFRCSNATYGTNGTIDTNVPNPTNPTNPTDATCVEPHVEGYYWREWKEQIPHDAFVAGETENSECRCRMPMFLGQGFVSVGCALIQPGLMFSTSRELKFGYRSRIYDTDTFIRILCTKNPESLKWIPREQFIRASEAERTNELVVAGYEKIWYLYFGRTKHNGNYAIGKIFRIPSQATGEPLLYYTYGDTQLLETENYELLVYKM